MKTWYTFSDSENNLKRRARLINQLARSSGLNKITYHVLDELIALRDPLTRFMDTDIAQYSIKSDKRPRSLYSLHSKPCEEMNKTDICFFALSINSYSMRDFKSLKLSKWWLSSNKIIFWHLFMCCVVLRLAQFVWVYIERGWTYAHNINYNNASMYMQSKKCKHLEWIKWKKY